MFRNSFEHWYILSDINLITCHSFKLDKNVQDGHTLWPFFVSFRWELSFFQWDVCFVVWLWDVCTALKASPTENGHQVLRSVCALVSFRNLVWERIYPWLLIHPCLASVSFWFFVQSMSLMGDFNNWNPIANVLVKVQNSPPTIFLSYYCMCLGS